MISMKQVITGRYIINEAYQSLSSSIGSFLKSFIYVFYNEFCNDYTEVVLYAKTHLS